MNDMVKKSTFRGTFVALRPEQLVWLQTQKKEKGISQSRIIRRMLALAQKNKTTLDKIFEQAIYD